VNAIVKPPLQIAGLLSQAGLASAVKSLTPLKMGGNNRSYRLETEAGVFALKEYFCHTADGRDRLNTEFDFCRHAAKFAPGMTPAPLARDAAAGLALYEYVVGQPYAPGQVSWAAVRSALDFFAALNTAAAKAAALALPKASEACFSLSRHLELIGQRLDGLAGAERASEEDEAAGRLVAQIQSHWQDMCRDLLERARTAGLAADAELEPSQRCISPSDFGFHNALLSADGSIRFLDFEYAGWDDPAKMSGDFFAQLAVPVPAEFFDRFVAEAVAPFAAPHELALRARLLRPVYQVKWCCIALNVFLPQHLARRQFADPGLDAAQLKRAQLDKAQKLFLAITTTDHGLH